MRFSLPEAVVGVFFIESVYGRFLLPPVYTEVTSRLGNMERDVVLSCFGSPPPTKQKTNTVFLKFGFSITVWFK